MIRQRPVPVRYPLRPPPGDQAVEAADHAWEQQAVPAFIQEAAREQKQPLIVGENEKTLEPELFQIRLAQRIPDGQRLGEVADFADLAVLYWRPGNARWRRSPACVREFLSQTVRLPALESCVWQSVPSDRSHASHVPAGMKTRFRTIIVNGNMAHAMAAREALSHGLTGRRCLKIW